MTWDWHPWWWWWPAPKQCQRKEPSSEDLIKAWDEHLASTRLVAERAAANVTEAERISEEIRQRLGQGLGEKK